MSATVSDNVTYFFARVGFDVAGVDTRTELAIDRFDQWQNPRDNAASVFTSITFAATAEAA